MTSTSDKTNIYKNLSVGFKSNGVPHTVLIIEDSLMAREMLRRILLSMQFKIIDEADNGEVALSKIKKSGLSPDFIFIDMEMPVMNGLETIKQIKPILPDSIIIMVTSHGEKELVTELATLGVQGYIKKPYDRDTILIKLAAILGRSVAY
jgi:two-component system chemotaxis response regulator CheY